MRNFKNIWEDFVLSDSPQATASKLLLTLALGSIIIAGGATLPGILKASASFFRTRKKKINFSQKSLRNSFHYLKKKKWLKIVEEKDGNVRVSLTNKGRKRLREFSLEAITLKKPKKWDQKWRICMFDIPAYPKKYNLAREALRNKIKELGFFQVQKSVWVYPYECEDEILFIAEMFEVQPYIEMLTVEKFLHENLLLRHFSKLCKL